MAAEKATFGAALGKIPGGVFVVTAGKGEKATGFLASWVQQAAFEPALISIAIKQGRPIQALIESGEPFAVHILGKGEKKIAAHFAKGFAPGENAFEGITTHAGATGAPIINGVTAHLECKFYAKTAAGDHVVVLAEVVAGAAADGGEPDVRVRKDGFAY